MKKTILIASLIFGILTVKNADAQLSISLNIGTQPTWGPTGYDHVDYYYLPDIDCYYYVPTKQFIYANGGTWVWSASLPAQYRNYDLYSGYKVVVNNQPKPYLQDRTFRTKYVSYKGRRGQGVIRDSHDPKYRPGNRPGNSHQPVKPQPKPNPGHQANHHPAPVKPKPKPNAGHGGNNHPAPAKSQPKPNSRDRNKDNKDDHHK